MDQLEIGFYSAVLIYGLILTWTVLARLSLLPPAFLRVAHRLLNSIEQIPILGHAISTCRRRPLSLGSLLAILVGVVLPFVVLSVMWLGYWLSFGIVIVLSVWAFFSGSEGQDLEPNPYDMYVEKSGHGIAYGDSPRADADRPLP
ncbi:MAG: hypothetical protein H6961_05855 [Chromatiaceae bacterium]|nr:hypothetical protein [Chromatiaceae bacterium]